MQEWKIFAAGCVGAIAPEIVRLHRLSRNRGNIFGASGRYMRQYLIVSALFVVLGGIIALLLEASSLHAAFYMGVSLPALISAIGGQAQLTGFSNDEGGD